MKHSCKLFFLTLITAFLLLSGILLPLDAIQTKYDPVMFRAFEWRNIGPFRGGRATKAVGIPSDPNLYYMGATGGGVWKTEDAGCTWHNISDGFFNVGSIGDIAVHRNNPSIIYVGTGEAPVRNQMSSYGDGVYKSIDAGKTWIHIGLEKTRQISRVLVHPSDPNLVYVAAQGSRWGPSKERGVFRSKDGGKTWERILFVSPDAGPSDLEIDPNNPHVLFAAFWDHQRTPWYLRSGGPGSGIWKTTDGGDSWILLKNGLPKGIMGKIGLDVSPANSNRVYAVIETKKTGMYRSDDGGMTWHRTSTHRGLAARPWYYCGVTADPQKTDLVYVTGVLILKSMDGGVTFTALKAPHMDTHSLWINPPNSQNMVLTHDGGTSVSFDGGATWSAVDNQPTGQFYGIQADDQFPYNLYGGQQDWGTVVIPSRILNPGRDELNWRSVGGGETARFAFDPKNPRITYATSFLGKIERFDSENGLRRMVSAWPAQNFAKPSDQMKYRFNWSAPLTTSPFDPDVMYHGANVVFRSSDGGYHWTVISPDLTRNDKSHQGFASGPFWNDGAGAEVYNTIFDIVESLHEGGTIWVGTDDGLVHLTRDHGQTWQNVTPQNLPEGLVNRIEVSPHHKATAYIAFTRHKWDDNTPHIFKTTDYGKTWIDLAAGLPQDYPVRVVREDPNRRDLLYAGTENAVWISFDGGGHWHSFQLNLPHVPISDLKVHHDDLLVSTEGRAFWILDDLTPLHQMNQNTTKAEIYLFKPRPVYLNAGASLRSRSNIHFSHGATIWYSLASSVKDKDRLHLDILDPQNHVVRHFAVLQEKSQDSSLAGLTINQGLNRIVWDLRNEPPEGAGDLVKEGCLLPSGRYAVRMTLGTTVVSQILEVLSDPRTQNTHASEVEHTRMALSLLHGISEISAAIDKIDNVRSQAQELAQKAKSLPPNTAHDSAIQSLITELDSVKSALISFNSPLDPGSQDPISEGLGLVAEFNYLFDLVDGTSCPVTQGEKERAEQLNTEWEKWQVCVDRILTDDVEKLNTLIKNTGLPLIDVSPKKKSF